MSNIKYTQIKLTMSVSDINNLLQKTGKSTCSVNI